MFSENKFGTTKVQPGAGSADGAEGAEAKRFDFPKTIKKALQNSQKQCVATSPPFGTKSFASSNYQHLSTLYMNVQPSVNKLVLSNADLRHHVSLAEF